MSKFTNKNIYSKIAMLLTLTVLYLHLSTKAWAGVSHSLQQTAITLQPGIYEARGQADLIMNRGGGINVSGHFRTGLIEDMLDIEGFLGTGKTDFKAGVQSKFNFLPDIPGQVGLAFIGGLTVIADDYRGKGYDTIKVLNLATIGSKKLDTTFGSVSPYAGVQLEMLFKDDNNDFPITGIVGSEWALADLAPWVFFSELDLDLNDSVFLFGVGGAYRF